MNSRPERKTKTAPNGDTIREAGDCRFVAPLSGTVHERAESDADEYDYEYHPKCGTRLPAGSLWSRVDADIAEEAVMKFNRTSCTKCIRSIVDPRYRSVSPQGAPGAGDDCR